MQNITSGTTLGELFFLAVTMFRVKMEIVTILDYRLTDPKFPHSNSQSSCQETGTHCY
jgi:hypothetical protein